MAFKIKKEWIPDKFRTEVSTPMKSESKSFPSAQRNIEIALDWGSGTTKILYRRSKDSAPHHFTLNQYHGPFEEDSNNLLPLTVAGRKGPQYYVPQSLSDQNTIRYFKVNLIRKPTPHSYDYHYAVINIASIVKAALEELAEKYGNCAITFYCGYPAKAEGNIHTLFSRIYKHSIELAQDPEFTPYSGVSAEFINKTRTDSPQMKIVMIPEISAESSFILKSNMLRK